MIKIIDKLEEILVITATLFAATITFINVVMRYVFRYSLDWPMEVGEFLLITVVYLGCSIAVRRNSHIRIDILPRMFPSSARLFENMGNRLFLVFGVILAALSAKYFFALYDMRSFKVSPAAGIPMFLPYLAVPLGSRLLVFRIIQWFVATWCPLTKNKSQRMS